MRGYRPIGPDVNRIDLEWDGNGFPPSTTTAPPRSTLRADPVTWGVHRRIDGPIANPGVFILMNQRGGMPTRATRATRFRASRRFRSEGFSKY